MKNMNNWIIGPVKGVFCDSKTGVIGLEGEGVLATARIGKDGRFNINLFNIDTQFTPDDNSLRGVGYYNDLGTHMGSNVWIIDQGGVLEYQKGRHFSKEKGKIIRIPIMLIKGTVFLQYTAPTESKSWLRKTFDFLENLSKRIFSGRAPQLS